MSKNKVAGFEIPIGDMKKAKEFYTAVFDWNLVDMGGGFMVNTAGADEKNNPTEIGGINGGMYPRKSPSDRPNLAIQTDDIDATLEKVVKAGGKILAPKHGLDDEGWMADIADPEGNEYSIMQWKKK